MKGLQCLVILSAWTCLSISVGIRVPSAWEAVPRQDGVAGFNGRINSNHHRFGDVNRRPRYDGGNMERRMLIENEQANAELGSLYNTLQSSALSNFFGQPQQTLMVSPNGVYMLPQNTQENTPISSETIQYRTELPPLRHPRYPQNPQLLQNGNILQHRVNLPNVPAAIGLNQYQQIPQNIPLGSIENKAYDQYQTVPSNVLRIMPSSGNVNWNNYNSGEQPVLKQPVVKQFVQKYKPLVHKEYARTPSVSYGSQIEVPTPPLKNYIAQDHTFIVSASTLSPIESDLNEEQNLAEFTTKKEPIFFVTEGYRNVLIQGPNKKKKYQKPRYQNQEASKKVLKTEKLENEENNEDDEDDEKPSRKRKVTKVYKINEHIEEPSNNLGVSRNLVDAGYEKPKQYFQRPPIEDDRRSGLRNHLIQNHRDDRLHEPIDDNDREREDDDKERIRDDKDESENENEEELVEENESEDDEESNNENASKSEKNETEKEESDKNKESDDDEEADDEDVEDEEEEENEETQKEVPHSEHADPKPVPTQPIYPGEGVWAKPGVKHRPYVSQHRFLKPQEIEQKPDGYNVFEDLEKYFENQKDQFGRTFGQKVHQPGPPAPDVQIKPPNSPNPIVVYDPFNEPSNREDVHKTPNLGTISNHQPTYNAPSDDTNKEQNAKEQPESDDENDAGNEASEENNDYEEESDKKEEFVPMQLYTQVRKSENEEHEAHDPLEHGRLREVIKDSKIQTVYTEEGFEDGAYDHAGHEKNAEQDQGHEEFEREKIKKGKPKDIDSHAGQSNKVSISDVPLEDSLPADSIYPSLPKESIIENTETSTLPTKTHQPSNNKNFITTQEVKTTQVKDKENGDVQLEIQSEVKVISQPNNSTKAHKYVKIYPKVLREYSKEVPEQSKDNDDNDGNSEKEALPSLTTTERSEVDFNKTSAVTSVDNKFDNIEDDILADIHNNVSNNTLTDAQLVTDSASTTEQISAAKVSVKSFANEFDKSTSEKPKVTVKVLDDEAALAKISDEFGKIGKSRRRRSTDEADKDLEIDLEFIDKINHTFAEKKPDTIDVEKYPYYTLPDLNENSPLRYAENINNIPVKRGGELSFYKMADKLECPDLPQSIDPIPEHVKNAKSEPEQSEDEEYDDEEEDDEGNEKNDEEENEDESIVDQKHPAPRIKLGDKIDCLKIRYFGDNPLDSPFFKEETVGPVKSIFKELEKKSAKIQTHKSIDNPQETSQIVENSSKVNEIFNQSEKKNERKFESEVKDKVYNALKETAQRNIINDKVNLTENEYDNAESINTNVRIKKPIGSEISSKRQLLNTTPLPLVTLITTPKYTLQLKPKNIYDQITLLDHLPEDEIVTEIIETSTKNIKTTPTAENKIQEQVTTEISAQKRIDQVDGKRESSRRELKTIKEEIVDNKDHDQNSPEADALRRRRFRPRKPLYQIFDVNKFLTTTPYSIINSVHNTVLPKHKVISEVFYKDEIKPNEQLNVFADILNNIKNSTNVDTIPLQSASDFAEPDAVTISNLEETNIVPQVQTSPNIRVKKYQKDSSNTHNIIGQNLATTEKHYNARFPGSYEDQHRTRSSTSKNVVNILYNNPDNFGYIDETTRKTAKNFYSDEDVGPYRSHSNAKVVPNTKTTLRRRRKPTKGTSTTSTTYRTTTNINVPVQSQSTPSNHKPYVIDVFKDSKDVVGLVPPSNGVYRTIVEDSDGTGTNEVPLQVYEYKTIAPNYVTDPLPVGASVTELIDEDTPSVRPMNKYYFLGLKPPSNQRARSYPEFIINKNVNGNNIRRRMADINYGHIRLKRGASRATYSEVSRNRGSQNEGIRKETTTPYDDTDDYIPHRPKNYHYDENTGKIVYHNKRNEEKESEEEEEYDEIPDTPGLYLESAEDATHPTPKKVTTKPLLATATPPPAGQGLLDFVAKLKNNPSYKFIPDPTTPDPSSKPTTQETVTIDPKSTKPPEFLNILSKVRSDSNYKHIEDPKESKSNRKSTTPEPEIEDKEEEEEEEEEEGSPSHRPHRRFVRQTNLQIFNIGDYLPKIQTPISSPIPKTPTNFLKKQIVERLFPRLRYMTPLDIAKEKIRERFQNNTVYQFIQKNIQNSPGGQSQDLANIQIFDIGEYLPKIKPVSPKTSIDYSKYKTIERPHTQHNISSRYNSDEEPDVEEVVPVRRPIVMEERESIDRPVVSQEKVVHDKKVEIVTERVTPSTTQKIVQFRRGTRPTTQQTTAETVEPPESIATRRTVNRKRPVPSGFRTTRRPTTTEVTEATEKVQRIYPQNAQTERTTSQTHDHAKRVYRKRPVRIRHTTERHEEDDDSVDKIVRRSLDLDYETDDIRNEFEEEFLEEQNIPQAYENIKQDIINGNNEETKVTETNKEIDTTAENKKLANSNVKEKNKLTNETINEKEASENNQSALVEIDVKITNSDLNQKHGGNLKRENKEENLKSRFPEENLNTEHEKADEDAEVKNITENHSVDFDSQEEATENENKEDVEIINHNYDKSKKHGGNYRRKNENKADVEIEGEVDSEDINNEQAKLLDETNNKPDVEIITQNFDKSKRHGGNYMATEDAITDEKLKVDKYAAEIQQTDSTKHVRAEELKADNDNIKPNDKVADTKDEKEDSKNNGSNGDNKRKRKRIGPKSITTNTKKVLRLTDIVPKPDHFYTDTRLPKEVNNLKIKESDGKLDSKELEELSKNGDESNLEETQSRSTDNRRKFNTFEENITKDLGENNEELSQNYDRNAENGSYKSVVNSDNETKVSTKKPVFIKDPSKRFYFYAPV